MRKSEDTKGAIIWCNLKKDRQYNHQMKGTELREEFEDIKGVIRIPIAKKNIQWRQEHEQTGTACLARRKQNEPHILNILFPIKTFPRKL